jgi:hypothetical protein
MKQELQLWCYDTDGNASIIDLYENENMYLQFQFNDLVDFTNVGNYSREFRIPASKTNIDFFGAIFNVNYNGWFDFRKKVDASIVVNTIPITNGHIQIKQIFESKEKLHEFQIVFFGETPNIARAVGEKKLKDIQSIANGDLDYALIHANVPYPNDNTILTLCDKFNWSIFNFENTTNFNDLYVGQLTPAVKTRYLVEQILLDAGFTYDGTIFDSITEEMYTPFVADKGLVCSGGLNDNQFTLMWKDGLSLSNTLIGQTSQQIQSTPPNAVDVYDILLDEGSNIIDNGIFVAPLTADYTFKFITNFKREDSASTSGGSISLGASFVNPDGVGYYQFNYFDTLGNICGALTPNIVDGDSDALYHMELIHTIHLNAGDKVAVMLQIFGAGGYATNVIDLNLNPYAINYLDYNQGTYFQYEGTSVELSGTDTIVQLKNNAPDMRQIDYIKSLAKVLNLAIIPSRTLPSHLTIVPLVEYLGTGNTLDWTSKLDTSKDVVISSTADMQYSKLSFTYKSDGDVLNKYFESAKRIYGEYKVEENDFTETNDFATGELAVSVDFSATPCGHLYGTNIVTPKFINDKGEFILPNCRLLFNAGRVEVKVFDEVSGARISTEVKLLNHYSSVFPDVQDNDLNFGKETPAQQVIAYPDNTSYVRFWRDYLRELYDGEARILEAYFDLNITDILTFQWSDRIYVKDSWWRILEISDYGIALGDSTKVKLARLVDLGLDCTYKPYASTLGGTILFSDGEGNTGLTGNEFCCERYGYYWYDGRCKNASPSRTQFIFSNTAINKPTNNFQDLVVKSIQVDVTEITSDYRCTGKESVIMCDTSLGTINLLMPDVATMIGKSITIINTSTNAVKISADTGTIEGSTLLILPTTYDKTTLTSDGKNLFRII